MSREINDAYSKVHHGLDSIRSVMDTDELSRWEYALMVADKAVMRICEELNKRHKDWHEQLNEAVGVLSRAVKK